MSWKATAFVKELRKGLTPTKKLVLAMLADYHRTDQKNYWPSVETLAQDCLMTARGVQQILAPLEATGFIVRDQGGGRGRVTTYKIVGLDLLKGELETVNLETVNKRVNEGVKPDVVKGEPDGSPYKVLPVLEPNGVNGELDALQSAKRLMEICGIPSIGGNLKTVKAALKSEALYLRVSIPEAARGIVDGIMRDRKRGIEINTFYFQDTKWRSDGTSKSNRKPSGGLTGSTEQYQRKPDFIVE